jgi:hypothetical protein
MRLPNCICKRLSGERCGEPDFGLVAHKCQGV